MSVLCTAVVLAFLAIVFPRALAISTPALPVRASRKITVAASKLGVSYGNICEAHFLPMATLQSGVLRGGADIVGQTFHPDAELEHVLAMALLGGLVSGCGNALWLKALERQYGSSTDHGVVLRKTVTDYICWAPLANSSYLFFLPLLTGKGVEAALVSLQDGFTSVMLLEMAIFMPYNLVAFEHVPISIRPLTSASLAALFTIGVGMLA